MYASRVTCITRHELDGQYENSEDGFPTPFLGQQLDISDADMLGFIAIWKGVVAALALSSKRRLLRCSILKKKKETSMKLKAITKTMVSERRKGYWSAYSHPHMQNVLEDIGIGNRLTMANMEKCAYLTHLQFAKSRQISLRCSSP